MRLGVQNPLVRATTRMSTSGINRPSENAYWVVPGRFAAGEYPGAKSRGDAAEKLRRLLGAGIDHFIDLTEPHELAPYAGVAEDEARRSGSSVEHERRSIRDGQVPQSRNETAAILDAIDAALGEGKTVYVHCWGGIGRTGAVVGCWLGPVHLKGWGLAECCQGRRWALRV